MLLDCPRLCPQDIGTISVALKCAMISDNVLLMLVDFEGIFLTRNSALLCDPRVSLQIPSITLSTRSDTGETSQVGHLKSTEQQWLALMDIH